MIQDIKRSIQERLCCGRSLFAVADLKGHPSYPHARGRVEFYVTPAGIAVFATFTELPQQEHPHPMGTIYRLSLAGTRSSKSNRFNAILPLLYVRDGNARFFVITQQISPIDLINSHLYIHMDIKERQSEAEEKIALGDIICHPYCTNQTDAV